MQKLYFFGSIWLGAWLLIQPGFAQTEADYAQTRWHKGQVELASGQTLAGNLKYQIAENVVFLQTQGAVLHTWRGAQIKSFTFYDTLRNAQRRFCALANPVQRSTKDAFFLEVVYEGFISLLSYEKTRLQAYPEDGQQKWRKPGYYIAVDEFYTLDMKGKLKKFTNEQALAQVVQHDVNALKDFIKTNKLDLQNRQDFATLISHYDQLVSKQLEKSNQRPFKGREVNLTER
jgi:hypothetical protein